MSNTVFPFTLLRPYTERAVHSTTVERTNSGNVARRAEWGSYGQMTIKGRARFPLGAYTVDDWHSFVVARQGGYDSFLYKCLLTRHRTQTLEAVGTGDGTTTVFYLDMKHVDSSTLLVYKAGVLQTLTTHYTFGGNNTAPAVTFVSAPTGGQAITATYDYYYPVRFRNDDLEPRDLNPTTAHSTSTWDVEIEMEETSPGAHRA